MARVATDIGAEVKALPSIAPIAAPNSASPIEGTAHDRTDYSSLVACAYVGAATGAPSSFSIAFKLEHSDSPSANYTTLAGTERTLTAAGLTEVDVNLRSAKRYVRAVATVTITGGSTPAVPIAVPLVMGGARELPV